MKGKSRQPKRACCLVSKQNDKVVRWCILYDPKRIPDSSMGRKTKGTVDNQPENNESSCCFPCKANSVESPFQPEAKCCETRCVCLASNKACCFKKGNEQMCCREKACCSKGEEKKSCNKTSNCLIQCCQADNGTLARHKNCCTEGECCKDGTCKDEKCYRNGKKTCCSANSCICIPDNCCPASDKNPSAACCNKNDTRTCVAQYDCSANNVCCTNDETKTCRDDKASRFSCLVNCSSSKNESKNIEGNCCKDFSCEGENCYSEKNMKTCCDQKTCRCKPKNCCQDSGKCAFNVCCDMNNMRCTCITNNTNSPINGKICSSYEATCFKCSGNFSQTNNCCSPEGKGCCTKKNSCENKICTCCCSKDEMKPSCKFGCCDRKHCCPRKTHLSQTCCSNEDATNTSCQNDEKSPCCNDKHQRSDCLKKCDCSSTTSCLCSPIEGACCTKKNNFPSLKNKSCSDDRASGNYCQCNSCCTEEYKPLQYSNKTNRACVCCTTITCCSNNKNKAGCGNQTPSPNISGCCQTKSCSSSEIKACCTEKECCEDVACTGCCGNARKPYSNCTCCDRKHCSQENPCSSQIYSFNESLCSACKGWCQNDKKTSCCDDIRPRPGCLNKCDCISMTCCSCSAIERACCAIKANCPTLKNKACCDNNVSCSKIIESCCQCNNCCTEGYIPPQCMDKNNNACANCRRNTCCLNNENKTGCVNHDPCPKHCCQRNPCCSQTCCPNRDIECVCCSRKICGQNDEKIPSCDEEIPTMSVKPSNCLNRRCLLLNKNCFIRGSSGKDSARIDENVSLNISMKECCNDTSACICKSGNCCSWSVQCLPSAYCDKNGVGRISRSNVKPKTCCNKIANCSAICSSSLQSKNCCTGKYCCSGNMQQVGCNVSSLHCVPENSC